MDISPDIKSRAAGLLDKFRSETLDVRTNFTGATVLGGEQNSRLGDTTLGNSNTSAEHSRVLGDFELPLLLEWLANKVISNNLSMTTAKCYRRWIASYLQSEGDPAADAVRSWVPPGSVEESMIVDETDARNWVAPNVLTGTKQIAQLAKANNKYLSYVGKESISLLVDQLVSQDERGFVYALGPAAALFFTSSMMTGLRPMEWESATLRDVYFDPLTMVTLGPTLDVLSLKQKARREDNPHRERRLLVLDEWPDDQLNGLRAFLELVSRIDTSYKTFYSAVRRTISRAWSQLVKVHPVVLSSTGESTKQGVSANTARHIFAEECRRSLSFTRYELAAMLGHSLITNQVYYGPRKEDSPRGFDFLLPRPWPGEAQAVQDWDELVNPLRQNYRQGVLDLGAGDSVSATADDEVWLRDATGITSLFVKP